MKRILIPAIIVAVLGSACGAADEVDDGRPLVMATTTILGDIVDKAAGDALQVEVLMPIGADPHDFSPSARQASRLREAVLVVANGVGLEEGLSDILAAAEADGVPVIRIGDLLDPQPYVAGSPEEHGEDNHDRETDSRTLDPHVWMDPVRMSAAVEIIAGHLSETAGVDVSDSAAVYQGEVLALHDEITTLIDEVPVDRRKMVTSHFSYGYYADRYGLEILGTVIPAATTAAEASPAAFAALVDLLEREGVSVIFGSTTESTTLADALAEEVGYQVKVVTLPTGSLGEGGSGAETYLDMMRTSTRLIVENLK